MNRKILLASVSAATVLWAINSMPSQETATGTSHPVRVYERDIETEVFGVDYGTDFVPGVYILPEESYYNTMELLARVVEAEAGNQGLDGKRMVVDVVLNRVKDKDFPDDIKGVLTEENAFTVYGNGMIYEVEPTEETWEAIRMELEEVGYPGLLYFDSEGYSEYGTPWKKVGDHYFSTK